LQEKNKRKNQMDETIRVQANAIRRMHGNALDIIDTHAASFRGIINSFHREFGRVPSANDLLWIASEKAGRDLTKGDG